MPFMSLILHVSETSSEKSGMGIGFIFDYVGLSADMDLMYFHVKFYGWRHHVAEWIIREVDLSNKKHKSLCGKGSPYLVFTVPWSRLLQQ